MTRFSKGLVAVATSAALLTGTGVAVAAPADTDLDATAASATLSAGLGSVAVGSAASVLRYGIIVAIVVGAYNWAVDQHLIQPIALPQ
ncbi:hypothetical protein C1Y63_01855 [Corynebacterium sp. 13CS0277]|uniref:hypothetical protein n=1 Tax=Corynebacterium sp. 13CS0277 TaxID=2071994 RepID=UPI000D0454AB|nr:hypothetical protein [Corynebacterium sp. 13CS0277]PRQ12321.1 hypothetical protein C1Y63_01855 [Corynebacterium sp. 13CS0277]